MSLHYVAVNWNRQKRIYDTVLVLGCAISIAGFAGLTAWRHLDATIETELIRGLAFTALLLLHIILAIGPLARLDRRFLPLLYNRRHLGVTMALLATAHASFAIVQYHSAGDLDPLVSVLTANGEYGRLAQFPFELFGIVALIVVLLMAATSHDYWLSVLTPPVWKRLHMLVYLAYLALLAHVGLGFLQQERALLYPIVLFTGAFVLGALHLTAARRERRVDTTKAGTVHGWIEVCRVGDIKEGRAAIGVVAGERVAVFRHNGKLSCVSNVCKHQNGPLGEGRIVDGCITCPWHGYQYRPETGASPAPFTDSVPTFNLKVLNGLVLVDPVPNAAGTYVEPVRLFADA